jgi:two-component system nitrogen regulation response regulator NtrX
LEVIPIHLPPLRDRLEAVAPLVAHAIQRLRKRQGIPVPHITDEAVEALGRYSWPGNVRELLNILERISILNPGIPVTASHVANVLPAASTEVVTVPPYQDGDPRPLRERMDEYEKELLSGALGAAKGSVAEAGRRLQTDRANLYRRMRRLGLRQANEDGIEEG